MSLIITEKFTILILVFSACLGIWGWQCCSCCSWHHSQQLLTWGWVIAGLHSNITRRRQQRALGRISSMGECLDSADWQDWKVLSAMNLQGMVLAALPGAVLPLARTFAHLSWNITGFWVPQFRPGCCAELCPHPPPPAGPEPQRVSPLQIQAPLFSRNPALPPYLPGLLRPGCHSTLPESTEQTARATPHTDLFRKRKTDEMFFLELLFQDTLWPFPLTSLIKGAYVVQEIWLVSMSGLLHC